MRRERKGSGLPQVAEGAQGNNPRETARRGAGQRKQTHGKPLSVTGVRALPAPCTGAAGLVNDGVSARQPGITSRIVCWGGSALETAPRRRSRCTCLRGQGWQAAGEEPCGLTSNAKAPQGCTHWAAVPAGSRPPPPPQGLGVWLAPLAGGAGLGCSRPDCPLLTRSSAPQLYGQTPPQASGAPA